MPVPRFLPPHQKSSGPVAESQRFPSQKEPSGFFAKHSKCASGSALTILARRENPPNGGCEQFRLGTENDRDQAKRIAANQSLQFTRKNRDRSRTMAIAATLSP